MSMPYGGSPQGFPVERAGTEEASSVFKTYYRLYSSRKHQLPAFFFSLNACMRFLF